MHSGMLFDNYVRGEAFNFCTKQNYNIIQYNDCVQTGYIIYTIHPCPLFPYYRNIFLKSIPNCNLNVRFLDNYLHFNYN